MIVCVPTRRAPRAWRHARPEAHAHPNATRARSGRVLRAPASLRVPRHRASAPPVIPQGTACDARRGAGARTQRHTRRCPRAPIHFVRAPCSPPRSPPWRPSWARAWARRRIGCRAWLRGSPSRPAPRAPRRAECHPHICIGMGRRGFHHQSERSQLNTIRHMVIWLDPWSRERDLLAAVVDR